MQSFKFENKVYMLIKLIIIPKTALVPKDCFTNLAFLA